MYSRVQQRSRGMTQRDTRGLDPRIVRSQAAIVPAAARHFLNHGYALANVDEIAAEAGVSKRTIYNLFESKDRLFRAVLDDLFATAESYATRVVGSISRLNLEETLAQAAVELAEIVSSEGVLRLRRLMIGEAQRLPELAAEYWARAPGRTLAALADRFAELAALGLLEIDDSRRAADHFAYLTIGASLDRALFHARQSPEPEELHAVARAGVNAFLRAYGARSPND
jgi:TetR/AcrR family transcriptional repressor of mexJK operon